MRCDCRRSKHQAEELELGLTRQEVGCKAMLSSDPSGSGLGSTGLNGSWKKGQCCRDSVTR